ncbi:MAG: formylglycine-generating enzyme family protein [Thermodesulfobacteriota bacterium]
MVKKDVFLFLLLGVFFVIGCASTSVQGTGTKVIIPGMVSIPAGEFLMGSLPEKGGSDEHPRHKVNLDIYLIDRYEVSNESYRQCVDAGKCVPPKDTKYYDNPDYAKHPVVYVDWSQAKAYCEWAGNRLPTEAEWEKAASWDDEGKQKLKYPWGSDTPDCSYANYGDCSGGTKEIGRLEKGKSPYGAYDMAGNVWEWVNDRYDEGYYKNSPSDNPIGAGVGEQRVVRGGSWFYGAYFMRSANRIGDDPSKVFDFRGFRCASSK